MAFQTPVPQLAWALSSVTNGAHGDSSQAGKTKVATSVGPKPSQWNSSSDLFSNINLSQVSRFMETTTASLKAGGQVGAETSKPTASSNDFIFYWKNTTPSYQPDMSTPRETQQMGHHKESTPPDTSFSHKLNSPSNSNRSSLTSTLPSKSASDLLLTAFLQNQSSKSTNPNGSGGNK